MSLRHWSAVATSAINKGIDEDFEQILETLDRLATGVCQGHEPGRACLWDLFGGLQAALREHIELEEKWVFGGLPPEERRERASEHERLSCLVAKAGFELECGYGDGFASLLGQLARELRTHLCNDRELELSFERHARRRLLKDGNINKILRRARLRAPTKA